MSQSIKVSVLTPIYNHKIEYVEKCLDSLAKQTIKEAEFILIDNGSTPESKKIIQKFVNLDSRFRVLNINHNRGYGSAMNIGLKAADGEFIGIVESDDFIEPEMFNDLYNIAKEKEVDIVKGTFFPYYGDDKPQNPIFDFPKEKYNKVLAPLEIIEIPCTHVCQWTAIYKRTMIINNDCLYSTHPGASLQDMTFVFKTWLNANKIYLHDKVYYHYRLNNSNSTRKKLNKTAWGAAREYDHVFKWMLKQDKFSIEQWAVYAKCEFVGLMHQFKNRMTSRKLSYLLFRIKPYFLRMYKKYGNVCLKYLSESQQNEYIELINHPYTFYKKYKRFANNKNVECNFIKNIFSVRNENIHKVVTILGVKIKIHRKANYLNEIQELNNKMQCIHNDMQKISNEIQNECSNLKTIIIAQRLHSKTFAKYKNAFQGKDVVLVCTGPSAKKYIPIKDAIHVGVNGAIYLDNVKLDYLFVQDNTMYQECNNDLNENCNKYIGNNCKKFYGIIPDTRLEQVNKVVERLPLNYSFNENVSTYILEDKVIGHLAYDLEYEPIGDFMGTPFSAMQFILYTNPKRVYLVGCDCSAGYAYNRPNAVNPANYQKDIWVNHIKPFVQKYYKNTQIISINPVGLKNVFIDIDTINKENSCCDKANV